jgi:hypothetical protein
LFSFVFCFLCVWEEKDDITLSFFLWCCNEKNNNSLMSLPSSLC